MEHPDQCPLCERAAKISDFAERAAWHVNCPECSKYIITYELCSILAHNPEAANLRGGISASVRRHYTEHGEPFIVTEGNFPAVANWKD